MPNKKEIKTIRINKIERNLTIALHGINLSGDSKADLS